MTELLTAAQMRAIEQAAIESGTATGLELMERAGAGVVGAIFEEWPELDRPAAEAGGEYLDKDDALRAVVLCGPGNNGGDGFVIARLLEARGWAVEVFLFGDPDKLPPDARVIYERWMELGVVAPLDAFSDPDRGWGCDLLVDALFGTGLTRGLRPLGELFWNMEDIVYSFQIESGHPRGRPAIVAVDIPSGICSDSGRQFPHEDDHNSFAACAHLTVTFHKAKIGHYLGDGATRSGKLVVVDIGLGSVDAISKPIDRRKGVAGLTGSIHPVWLRKDREDHKFSHGHALVLTGGSGRTGAARLTARSALRAGAGLVTLGVPGSAQMEVAAQITALMLRRLDDAAGLADVLKDKRLNALCLGPGLGLDRARALVPEALKSGRKTVLDADALSAFADPPDALFDMLHPGCVLTPHGGEFARLFPDIAARLSETPIKGPAYSKVDATRAAAERAGCVVLFKGPDTVIAAPDGRCAINAAVYDRAAPWLATAGSGDVLAGIITGLLARGFDPFMAAESGAWLHVEAARAFGPGLIAEDLPEMLPQVFRDLGL